MKKKFLSFMLALALVVTGATLLAGCGDPADVEVQIGKKKYQYTAKKNKHLLSAEQISG